MTRLRRWRKRLEGSEGLRFHPVEVVEEREVAPATDSAYAAIEVIVGTGRRIAVRSGFDRQLLRDVVEALEAC